MPQLIFTFTINSETQEAAFAGNVKPQAALHILQQLVVAEEIRKAKEKEEKNVEDKK